MSRPIIEALAPGEAERVVARHAETFGESASRTAERRWNARLERGEVLGLRVDGEVRAQARAIPAVHWFGGRAVPCLDVASVAVAPVDRGRGFGRMIMEGIAGHARADGRVLSLLFPATSGFYRRVGWEHAGTLTRYEAESRVLPGDGPVMRHADRPGDRDAIVECQRRAAARASGEWTRPAEMWAALDDAPYHYVLDDPAAPGSLEAYALVAHERDDWQFWLDVRDWRALTPRGLAAVVGLAGREGSMGRGARWYDAPAARWLLRPVEQLHVEQLFSLHWMARVTDVAGALAARGYPEALALTTTLEVSGPHTTTGPLRLEVSGGRATVETAPGADSVIDGRGLAPLYTGFRHPRELRDAGLLEADDAAVDALAAVFAGPAPVLHDFF